MCILSEACVAQDEDVTIIYEREIFQICLYIYLFIFLIYIHIFIHIFNLTLIFRVNHIYCCKYVYNPLFT